MIVINRRNRFRYNKLEERKKERKKKMEELRIRKKKKIVREQMEWKTENKFLKFFSLCVSSKVSKPLSIQLYMSEALNKVVYVCSIATHTKKKKQQNE